MKVDRAAAVVFGSASILYLSYDGMTDPLGPSQVLPYLEGLTALGHRVTLVSFEKPGPFEAGHSAIAAQCEAAGIRWVPQGYTKSPPILSTLKDIRTMERTARRLHAETPFDIVHCRSYIAAMVGQAMKWLGVRFLFDMRGFWADERVESGLWPLSNPVYRAAYHWVKRKEAQFLREADAIVVLTEEARTVLADEWRLANPKRVTVIPCCTDFAAFPPITPGRRADARALLGMDPAAPVAAYLGSIGTWYMLGEMLDAFARQQERDPASVMLFVTRDEPGPIETAAAARGIGATSLRIRPASRDEVPVFLAAADYGLFFIRPTFSKRASSPVKLGELLALGLPVLTNAGVGDVDRILAETGAGVAIERLDQAGYDRGLEALAALRPDPERLQAGLAHWFDLAEGVRRYDAIYTALVSAAAQRT